MNILNKFYITIVLIVISSFLYGQCDDRYDSEIFENVTIETVTYSDVTGFEMDIYQPVGDTYTNRPLILLAHGGAFFGGSKNNPTMRNMCTTFAKRGYVTASIQYTLAPGIVSLADSMFMIDIVMSAVADGKSAIRYFRKSAENGNQFGIDESQIWAGGNSAGAILMAHLAYIGENDDVPQHIQSIIDSQGGLEGDAGNDGYSSEVSGVINLAGGLNNPDWISADEEPLVSCHGDMDGIVPFDCNDVYWGDTNFGQFDLIDLCGSEVLNARAEEIGVDHDLLVFVGEDHTPWSLQPLEHEPTMIDFVKDFIKDRVECNIISNNDNIEEIEINTFPNPATEWIQFFVPTDVTINEIQLFTISGQLINRYEVNSSSKTILVEHLQSGIYVTQIQTSSGVVTRRVVIN